MLYTRLYDIINKSKSKTYAQTELPGTNCTLISMLISRPNSSWHQFQWASISHVILVTNWDLKANRENPKTSNTSPTILLVKDPLSQPGFGSNHIKYWSSRGSTHNKSILK